MKEIELTNKEELRIKMLEEDLEMLRATAKEKNQQQKNVSDHKVVESLSEDSDDHEFEDDPPVTVPLPVPESRIQEVAERKKPAGTVAAIEKKDYPNRPEESPDFLSSSKDPPTKQVIKKEGEKVRFNPKNDDRKESPSLLHPPALVQKGDITAARRKKEISQAKDTENLSNNHSPPSPSPDINVPIAKPIKEPRKINRKDTTPSVAVVPSMKFPDDSTTSNTSNVSPASSSSKVIDIKTLIAATKKENKPPLPPPPAEKPVDHFRQLLEAIEDEDWNHASEILEAQKDTTALLTGETALHWLLMSVLVRCKLEEDDPMNLFQELATSGLIVDIKKLTLTESKPFETELEMSKLYVDIFISCSLNRTDRAKVLAGTFLKRASSVSPTASRVKVPDSWKTAAQTIVTTDGKPFKSTDPPESKEIAAANAMKQRWKQILASSPDKPRSPAMDVLMEMIGLSSVKSAFLDLYERIVIAKTQKVSLDSSNYNVQFVGNPGTGKTTVAELFAQFLTEIGFFDFDCQVIKKTGADLIEEGVSGLQKLLETLKGDGGGVMFIDEAYQLCSDNRGHSLLNYILGESERLKGKYGKIVWIIAGYKKQMEDLIKFNPGLSSRFPNKYHFEDYTNEELLKIFEGFLNRGGDDLPVMTKKQKKQKEETARATSISMNPNRNIYSNYPGAQGYPDTKDQWGNLWKWDQNNFTWNDAYGNTSGYGPAHSYQLGTTNNPIINQQTGIAWIFDNYRKEWHDRDNSNKVSKTYPGKPVEDTAGNRVRKNPFTCGAKWARIATRRVGRRRGVEGFGNAREIRNLFQNCHERQTKRISRLQQQGQSPDLYTMTREDLLGEKGSLEQLQDCPAWKDLQAMEGLAEVKQSIQQLLKLVVTNLEREEEEKPLLEVNLNRIFLGNPGTGKTTVAGLYAKILKHVGILSKGNVLLKTASDFIGSVLGKSEEITRGILEEAKGSVLVIDEAYGLYQATGSGGKGQNEPYRDAVINTLVEQIQGSPGEDRAVVLLGYRDEMETMLANVNPGLSRRFQLESAFQFADYDDSVLLTILKKAVKQKELKIKDSTATFAIKQLAKAKARPHFGNAGAVNNLLGAAILRMQQRAAKNDELVKEDFVPEGWTEEMISPADLLAKIVGNEEIRQKLQNYCNLVRYNERKGLSRTAKLPFNFLFLGPPGTGKTTVARLMGKMFCSLQLIPFDEVIEMSASDLVTGYVGQAGIQTRKIFEKAKGKVLFIDEAYQLNPERGGSFMSEAIDEIVKLMTSEDYKQKLVIILAGYEQDMNQMLQVNAGLNSRFQERISFHPLSEEQIYELLLQKLVEKDEAVIDPQGLAALPEFCRKLKSLPAFANGRDIETFVDKVIEGKVSRLHEDEADEILGRDLEYGIQALQRMKPALVASTPVTPAQNPPQQQFASQFTRPPILLTETAFATTTATATDRVTEIEEIEELAEDEEGNDTNEEIAAADWGPRPFLSALQDILDREGLNQQEKIREIAHYPLDHPTLKRLIAKLVNNTDYSREEIEEMLRKWQGNQQKVETILREQAKAKEEGKLGLVPIWRCAVCGRAN